MKKDRNAFKAGLFIVVTIVLIVVIVVSIKGAGRFVEPQQTRTAEFKLSDDLGGLREGDEVRIGGYKAGTARAVEPVGFDTGQPRLRVRFELPERYRLKAGAVVGVQTTLTGTSVLNIA